jgi:hypothetical protein
MNGKEVALSYGFWQIPKLIATSKRFTASEKLVLGQVLDLMWQNKQSKKWKTTCFPGNDYLAHFCCVSESTITRLKKKVERFRMFDFVTRYDDSDVWILKGIPARMVADYEAKLAAWDRKKRMSSAQIAAAIENGSRHFDRKPRQKGKGARQDDGKKRQKASLNRHREADRSEADVVVEPSARTTTPKGTNFEGAASPRGGKSKTPKFPRDLSSEQVGFCVRFKSAWEKHFEAKYTKRDWKAVKLIDSLDKAVKFLAPFFRDAVSDQYMADSDHSLTVFANNLGIINARFDGTHEGMEESLKRQAESAARRAKEREIEERALAALVEADPDNPKWYDRYFGNLWHKVAEYLSESTRERVLAEAKKRQVWAKAAS